MFLEVKNVGNYSKSIFTIVLGRLGGGGNVTISDKKKRPNYTTSCSVRDAQLPAARINTNIRKNTHLAQNLRNWKLIFLDISNVTLPNQS